MLTKLTVTLLDSTLETLAELTRLHNQQFPEHEQLTPEQFLSGSLGWLLADELKRQQSKT